MTLWERDQQAVLGTYERLPLEIDSISGSRIRTLDGKEYLDFFCGVAVNNLGYDEGLVQAMKDKMNHYLHTSNYFIDPDRTALAELLLSQSFKGKVFFTNSGTEASEGALKLVRKWGRLQGRSRILSAHNSFHGRSTGALALTGQPKYQQEFMPLIPVEHFIYNDPHSLKAMVNPETAAVFVEPVQGEAGVIPMREDFATCLKELQQKFGFLLVVDEIQTAMMRCGSLFAYTKLGLEPDLVTLAKSIGGGLPLGAVLIREELSQILTKGDHGSTFGGNPVACAGGRYLVERLLQKELQESVSKNAQYLFQELERLGKAYPIIEDVRGWGMMIGIQVKEALEIRRRMMVQGVLINVTGGQVIRLLPPVNINREDCRLFIQKLEKVLQEISDQ